MHPEYGAISHQDLAYIERADDVVDLPQSNFVIDREARAVAGCGTIRRNLLRECLGVTGIALLSALGLEVIEDYAGGDNFDKSIDRIAMPGLELMQQSAIVRAQLEIGLLDKIIQVMGRNVRTLPPGGASDNLGDERLKSANEFCPCAFVVRADAYFDQVFRREC